MTPDMPDKAVPIDAELRRLCENWLEDEALEVAADLERHGQLTLSTAIHEGRRLARALLSRLSAGTDAGALALVKRIAAFNADGHDVDGEIEGDAAIDLVVEWIEEAKEVLGLSTPPADTTATALDRGD